MRTCTLSACVLSAVALIASAGLPVTAQQPGSPIPGGSRPIGGQPGGAQPGGGGMAQAAPTPAWASKLITVKFPGGPLKQYVDIIKASVSPATMNVTYSNQASEAVLPPIDLTNISVQSAIEMLSHVTDPNTGAAYRASLIVTGKSADESPIYFVSESNPTQRGATELTQVLSLAAILEEANGSKVDAKSVLQAIESAVEVATQEGQPPAVIKFHEPTSILIVAGTREQCNTASEVVGKMGQAAMMRSGGMQPQGPRIGPDVPEVNTVPLSHADASALAEAINSVFRGRPGEKTEVAATADQRTNSVVVKGPKRLQVGVDAIVALLDRPEPLPAVREARELVRRYEVDMKNAAVQIDRARAEAEEQSKLARDRIAQAEKEGSVLRQSAERIEVRLMEMEKQLEQARKTAAELADRLQAANDRNADLSLKLRAAQEDLAKLKK